PCGNGVIDDTEQCDGTNLRGRACSDLGAVYGGVLACTSTCGFDMSGCLFTPSCGDGVAHGPEQCDQSDLGPVTDCTSLGFDTGTISCHTSCAYDTSDCSGGAPVCPNGVRNESAGEGCDGTDFGSATCATFGFTGGTLLCTG